MQGDRVYKKMRGKEVKYQDCTGICCGFADGKYIAATEETKPRYLFRKLDKRTDMFIEEEYRDTKFKYFYFTEWDFFSQHKRMKQV